MDIFLKALQLIISLSLLVITHELGHFFFAKLFHARVDKFYIFFNPWFTPFKKKIGETEYGIGWLPLGGYCKIAGMVDESMDIEALKQPVQEWEFRAKSTWQRLLMMLGGVLVNFVSALFIFWMLLYTWGESYMPLSEAKFGMQFPQVMQNIGFENGDKILGVDGKEVETVKQVTDPILFGECNKVNVLRGNETVDITIPQEFFRQILESETPYLLTFLMPVVVDSAMANLPAAQAGLTRGDSIIAIDNKPITGFNDFHDRLAYMADTQSDITFVRGNDTITNTVHVDAEGRIGIFVYSYDRWMTPKILDYNLLTALPAGISKGMSISSSYLKQLPMIFSKEGATKVGGFGTIGNLFPATWDWQAFWFNTAFLAIILAIMNVLPIPALDGGHVLFVLVEIITGKKPSDRFLENAQRVGMTLLIALVVYANFNDVIRAIAP